MSSNMAVASNSNVLGRETFPQPPYSFETLPQRIWGVFFQYLSLADIRNLLCVSSSVRDRTIETAFLKRHTETLKFTEDLIVTLKSVGEHSKRTNLLEKLYKDFVANQYSNSRELKRNVLKREDQILGALGLITNSNVLAEIGNISPPNFFSKFSSVLAVYDRINPARRILSEVRQDEAFKKICKDLLALGAVSQMTGLPKTIVRKKDDILLEVAGTLNGEKDLRKRTFLIEQIEDSEKRRMAFQELSEAHRKHGALDSSRRALKIADFREYVITTNEEKIFQKNLRSLLACGDVTGAEKMAAELIPKDGTLVFGQIDAVEIIAEHFFILQEFDEAIERLMSIKMTKKGGKRDIALENFFAKFLMLGDWSRAARVIEGIQNDWMRDKCLKKLTRKGILFLKDIPWALNLMSKVTADEIKIQILNDIINMCFFSSRWDEILEIALLAPKGLPESSIRDEMFSNISVHFLQCEKVFEALQSANHIEDQFLRDSIFLSIFKKIFSLKSFDLLLKAIENISDENSRNNLSLAVVRELIVLKESGKAFEIADKMPKSLAKAEVYRDLAKYFVSIEDREKATKMAFAAYSIIKEYPWNKPSFSMELADIFIAIRKFDLVVSLASSISCNFINNQGLISISLDLAKVNELIEARKILNKVNEFLSKSLSGWNSLRDKDFKRFFAAWAIVDFDKALEIACVLPSISMYNAALEAISLSLFTAKKLQEAKEAALMISDDKIKARLLKEISVPESASLKRKRE